MNVSIVECYLCKLDCFTVDVRDVHTFAELDAYICREFCEVTLHFAFMCVSNIISQSVSVCEASDSTFVCCHVLSVFDLLH